jgi:hypothetical protein
VRAGTATGSQTSADLATATATPFASMSALTPMTPHDRPTSPTDREISVETATVSPGPRLPNSMDESTNSFAKLVELARNQVAASVSVWSGDVEIEIDAMTSEAITVDVLVTRTVTGHDEDGLIEHIAVGNIVD